LLLLLLHAGLLPGLSHGGAKLMRRQCCKKGHGLLLLLEELHALRPAPWQLLLHWGRLQELLMSYKRRLLKLLLAVGLRPHAGP
jgi:hypothetical protein